MKVAIIGAGSLTFARRMMRDILSVPEFADMEFALADINKRNLDMAMRLTKRDIKANGLPACVTGTVDRRTALKDADYVINLSRIGGLEAFKTEFPKRMKEEPPVFTPDTRSHEPGSYIIEGLETGRVYRGHFNVVNDGCISNLPEDAIVEVPGYVDRNGIGIPAVGDLPLGCAAICNASITVQRMAVEAAVYADVDLLKQAAMMDPLKGAVCNTAEISQMVDEMLVGQAKWLPQYAKAISATCQRLRTEKRLGTRKTTGAARKRSKAR